MSGGVAVERWRMLPSMSELQYRVSSTVFATGDARRLASFYERLLGWVRLFDEPGWVKLVPLDPSTGQPAAHAVGLAFHHDDHFRPPIWPSNAFEPPMTAHLDVAVPDLNAGVDGALALGARLADHQPQEDVAVLLDPDGHPFCLFADPSRFDAARTPSDSADGSA